jgi:hypothetical protein
MAAVVTIAEIRRLWPPTCDVGDAAKALGVSRATLYAAMASGTAPVKVITVNKRMKVLTASLLATLEGTGTSHVAAS